MEREYTQKNGCWEEWQACAIKVDTPVALCYFVSQNDCKSSKLSGGIKKWYKEKWFKIGNTYHQIIISMTW